MRNAKLRLSRKALFAGGLLPVLDCYRHPIDAMLDYLDERMSVPPLDRIADAFADHGAIDPGVRTLSALCRVPRDPQRPRSAQTSQGPRRYDASNSPVFTRVAELGKEFETGLLSLLFDDPELRRWAREYIVF